jgi:hypothetical protein
VEHWVSAERKIKNKNPLGAIVAGEQSAKLIGNNVILDLGKLLVSALQIPAGLTPEIYLSLLILVWH